MANIQQFCDVSQENRLARGSTADVITSWSNSWKHSVTRFLEIRTLLNRAVSGGFVKKCTILISLTDGSASNKKQNNRIPRFRVETWLGVGFFVKIQNQHLKSNQFRVVMESSRVFIKLKQTQTLKSGFKQTKLFRQTLKSNSNFLVKLKPLSSLKMLRNFGAKTDFSSFFGTFSPILKENLAKNSKKSPNQAKFKPKPAIFLRKIPGKSRLDKLKLWTSNSSKPKLLISGFKQTQAFQIFVKP